MPWEIPIGQHEEATVRASLPLPMWCLLGGGAILLAVGLGLWASTGSGLPNFDPTHPSHLLIVAAALLGSAFVFQKPELGLFLFVALLYSNASEIAVRNHGLPSLLQALGVLLSLVVFGRWLGRSRERPRGDVLLALLMAYGVVLFSSSVYASNPVFADEKLIEHIKGLLILALVINLVRSRVTLDRAVWTLVIVGAVLGTISALQVITSSYGWDFGGFARVKNAQIVGDLRQPRIAGPFADPNFYAQILIPLVPLALYRLLDESSRLWKLLSTYALAACLVTLVFTYSRGGILALVVVLGLVLIIQRPRLKYCLAGVALLGSALVLVPQQFERRLGTLSQFMTEDESAVIKPDSSFQQRSLMMRVALEEWREHPFIGVGAGNYSEHYQEYAERIGSTVSSYESFNKQRFAHSLYLEVAAETGLAGLSVLIAILVAVGIRGWYAIRIFYKVGDFKAVRLVTSLLVGIVGYLTTSIFLHGHYLRHFWLLLALVAASAKIAREVASDRMPEGAP